MQPLRRRPACHPAEGRYFVYTVSSLTEKECTFSGNNVPMTDIPGDVVVHLVRIG